MGTSVKLFLRVLCALSILLSLNCRLSEAQFCSYRGCCPGRNDDCTARYYITLCYCDMFCLNTASDCCPDFQSYCLDAPPREESRRRDECLSDGATYSVGAIIRDNCNTCTCTLGPDEDAEFVCDETSCLIDSDDISDINYENHGWRASNYSFFWGLTQEEGVLYRLGTFSPGDIVGNMFEVRIDVDVRELPESFDSRQRWPELIGGVINQGNCGSSWAVSTSSVASDRLAIQSRGGMRSRLSEQHLLSCDVRGQRGCSGGYLDRAWWFLRRRGIVSRDCYPYESGLEDGGTTGRLICRIPYGATECPEGEAAFKLYQSTPPYRISSSEVDIMTEIYRNGPVQATFNVKKDFFLYKSGVYRHTRPEFAASQSDPNQAGWHSVKIVGWGVDTTDPRRPIKYWLCTNSWGREWGEDGMFRIVRGENESDIESFVLGVWMPVNQQ